MRPSLSTTTVPCGVFLSERARLPRSDPMKLGHEVVRGVLDDLARRADLRDPRALLQDHDLVAEQERLVDVVRDEHDRLVELALQADELLLQVGAHDGVDRAERLVHEQDVRIGRESARDADALLLAAGQLARVALGERAVQPDGVEQRRAPARAPASCGTPLSTGTVATLSMTLKCGMSPEFCMT